MPSRPSTTLWLQPLVICRACGDLRRACGISRDHARVDDIFVEPLERLDENLLMRD